MGEGGFVAEPRPKKSYQPRRLLVGDVEDHIDPMTRAWITVDEDGRLVFPQASEAKSAALGARFEAWLLTQTVNSEQARWLGLVGSQIRANADTWTEVSAGNFAFAPFSNLGGVGHAIRLFGGEKALETTLISLNAFVFADPVFSEARDRQKEYSEGDRTLP
jgi:type I restriction enzyme R subunit